MNNASRIPLRAGGIFVDLSFKLLQLRSLHFSEFLERQIWIAYRAIVAAFTGQVLPSLSLWLIQIQQKKKARIFNAGLSRRMKVFQFRCRWAITASSNCFC